MLIPAKMWQDTYLTLNGAIIGEDVREMIVDPANPRSDNTCITFRFFKRDNTYIVVDKKYAVSLAFTENGLRHRQDFSAYCSELQYDSYSGMHTAKFIAVEDRISLSQDPTSFHQALELAKELQK